MIVKLKLTKTFSGRVHVSQTVKMSRQDWVWKEECLLVRDAWMDRKDKTNLCLLFLHSIFSRETTKYKKEKMVSQKRRQEKLFVIYRKEIEIEREPLVLWSTTKQLHVYNNNLVFFFSLFNSREEIRRQFWLKYLEVSLRCSRSDPKTISFPKTWEMLSLSILKSDMVFLTLSRYKLSCLSQTHLILVLSLESRVSLDWLSIRKSFRVMEYTDSRDKRERETDTDCSNCVCCLVSLGHFPFWLSYSLVETEQTGIPGEVKVWQKGILSSLKVLFFFFSFKNRAWR